MRGSIASIGIYLLRSMEYVDDLLIARIGFAADVHFQFDIRIGLTAHVIGNGAPQQLITIDHALGYLLTNDTQHDLVDHLLFLVGMGYGCVVRFQFVA